MADDTSLSNTPDTPLKPLDILEKYHINLQQEMFCQYFTSPTEFFGNGVQSYASAYGFDVNDARDYASAKTQASRLLTNVHIIARLNDLLDAGGLNDHNVDKQLLFLVSQSADFSAKLGAIREYNKLKARVTEKMDLTSGDMPITTINIIPALNAKAAQDAAKKEAENNDNTGPTPDSGEAATE